VNGGFTESELEEAALDWLDGVGYTTAHGAEIAPGEARVERDDHHEVLLARRLREALERLNPDLPSDLLDEAFRKLTRTESPSLIQNNPDQPFEAIHQAAQLLPAAAHP
jgi:type I restriction enzyme R subunit